MKFYSLGQLNNEDKNNILQKHREIYNGYRTVWQPVSNEQPLYVQDFANDKLGVQVDNKGGVSSYNNKVYMREQVEETELDEMSVEEDIYDVEDLHGKFDYIESKENDLDEFESAFSDELGEEISGPLYSEVEPAYDFVSDGPMQSEEFSESFFDTSDYESLDFPMDKFSEEDEYREYPSFDLPLEKRIRKTPESDIIDIDFEEIDDDMKENFLIQKNKIDEMFLRFSKYN